MTQSKYIIDLLHKTKMTKPQPVSSPLASSCKLSKTISNLSSDPTLYKSVVGTLQYATLTRPNINYVVNKVCQFTYPLFTHWTAVKRILRYLKGTVSYGLHMQPATKGQHLSITAMSDVDWASNTDDRGSTSGSAIYLSPNLVSWWSCKERVIGRSSPEVEYHSLAQSSA